jgi:RNA polymerase sigma-70 factor (ECF subfamily)
MNGLPDCPPATDPPPAARRTDRTLLKRYQAGDDSAATDLYARYAPRLRALARHYCAPDFAGRFDPDDVVQSVFRAFFHGARQRSYDVPPDGELWGLLLVLALNKVRELIGRHRAGKRSVYQTTHVDDLDALPALTHDEAAAALLRMIFDEHLTDLPASNREIIRLRIEGYEVGEIAGRTGRARRTVERVLQDFRHRLTKS